MADDEPEIHVADLARRIEDADRPSAPIEQRLRRQWNVPYGTTPYIPFWFALAFLSFLVLMVIAGLFGVL